MGLPLLGLALKSGGYVDDITIAVNCFFSRKPISPIAAWAIVMDKIAA
jgi:hypothetical protein